jgi:hypothetical protein
MGNNAPHTDYPFRPLTERERIFGHEKTTEHKDPCLWCFALRLDDNVSKRLDSLEESVEALDHYIWGNRS